MAENLTNLKKTGGSGGAGFEILTKTWSESSGGYNYGQYTIFNVSDIDGYQDFTVDNFIVGATYVYQSTAVNLTIHSYDPSNGNVTITMSLPYSGQITLTLFIVKPK